MNIRIDEIRVENLESLKHVVENIDFFIENDITIEYYNEFAFRMKAKQLKEMFEEGVFKFNE